ncbi:hypothetical protein B484DRAFT_389787, partial [Ochromonadaceae sp. CCMP2298]
VTAVTHHRALLSGTILQLEERVLEQAMRLGEQGGGVGVGIGVGTGMGAGMGVGTGMGVGMGVGVGAGMGIGAGAGAGIGAGAGAGVGAGAGAGIGAGAGADELASLPQEEERLHAVRTVKRALARAQAAQELAGLYRTGLVALYADGATYSAA